MEFCSGFLTPRSSPSDCDSAGSGLCGVSDPDAAGVVCQIGLVGRILFEWTVDVRTSSEHVGGQRSARATVCGHRMLRCTYTISAHRTMPPLMYGANCIGIVLCPDPRRMSGSDSAQEFARLTLVSRPCMADLSGPSDSWNYLKYVVFNMKYYIRYNIINRNVCVLM